MVQSWKDAVATISHDVNVFKGLKEHFNISRTFGHDAVFIVARDNSGSMSRWETNACVRVLHWYSFILNNLYPNLKTEYIVHGTEAKLVDLNTFIAQGGSGGTIVSTALELILELIVYHNNPNTYVLYMSDGDNLTADGDKVVSLLTQGILPQVRRFSYLELNQYNRSSTLAACLRNTKHDKLSRYVMREDSQTLHCLEVFTLPIVTPADTNEENSHRLQRFDDWLYRP